MEIKLKCKDFDAWLSFLRRLGKIGTGYFIKNDIIMATVNGLKSTTSERIPGRHIIKDPLYVKDDNTKDIIYVMMVDANFWVETLTNIKTNNKDARKEIIYSKDQHGIYIHFYGGIKYQIFKILSNHSIDEDTRAMYEYAASGFNWFNDLLTIPTTVGSTWVQFKQHDLIDLRNKRISTLAQYVSGMLMWTRIAKSLFTMAGTSRFGTPIAMEGEYSFLPPSKDSDSHVGTFNMHVKYRPPMDSKFIDIECIHEYTILIYGEENQDD